MKGGHYMTVQDLVKLTGICYNSAARKLRQLREKIAKGKHSLLIEEYCELMKENFEQIWKILRKGERP